MHLSINFKRSLSLGFFLALGCGKPEAVSLSAAYSPSITMPLTYYNTFAFNHVYTTTLTLGGKPIETVLDTGSSNLLVIGDGTLCPGCVNEYGYNSTYTPGSTAQSLGTTWSMSFAPIGSAEITGYEDTMVAGGITLPKQGIGVVTSEQGIPNIWGIAYADLANPSGDPQTPLFDAMVTKGSLQNVFSLRLCGTQPGSRMVLGDYDSSVSLSGVLWTPIAQKQWYVMEVSRMYLSDSTGLSWSWTPGNYATVIVDSGTNPLVLPSRNIAALVSVLQSVATAHNISIPTSFWPTTGPGDTATLSDEDIAVFPAILLDIPSVDNPSEAITLSISPQTYFQTQKTGERYLGIEPGSGNLYILGTVFMENYVVLHKRGALDTSSATDPTAQIGFYPIAGLCK